MTEHMASKKCRTCGERLELTCFAKDASKRDGLRTVCRDCDAHRRAGERAKQQAEHDAREAEQLRRLASDFDVLKPEDFDVSVGNVPRSKAEASNAAKEKRQEYNAKMGETMEAFRAAAIAAPDHDGDVLVNMPEDVGEYIGKLAEQEFRFGNRRLARSVALAAAHEALAIRQFKQAASVYLRDKIQPVGYALKKPRKNLKRTVVLLLSDLHLGSDLNALDEPVPFRAIEEARRLEYVIRQALDYKPQYRENTRLVLILAGDMVEGQLMHDFRSGAPLTEQKVIFWRYFRAALGVLASAFRQVLVVCQPGNHGRDKVRHPGRATSRKWDGHEWEMYYGLQMMSASLANVEWQIDFRAVSVVDLYGSKLGITHGDTEVKLADPDTRATQNASTLDRINSANTYGVQFDAWAFGHFHKPRYQPRNPRVVFNGALVPPNGYARGAGYIGEPCGQFLWEAVEGFPVGDIRFIEVGESQDRDEKLGTIIEPFRFE